MTEYQINVSITDDVKDELNEEFLALLENVTFDPRVTVFPDVASVIIIDDDSKSDCAQKPVRYNLPSYPIVGVTIGLLHTELVLDEDVGTVEVCARILVGDLDRQITVTLSTSDGTATGTYPITQYNILMCLRIIQCNILMFNYVPFSL